jgi:uncharacterized protein YutE (UPF0331/DUF86 family)/predicted nucleotidyltransferase
MTSTEQLVATVQSALEEFPDISFAFLFGSAASERLRADSDIDLAVYGSSEGLEIESDRRLVHEIDIQIAVERATGRNVDLLVLNRAPATVCSAALLHGLPVLVRNGGLYSRYFLAVTSVAIDFLETEREFRRIRDRSASLSEIDRNRLLRILEFIQQELEDQPEFETVTHNRYQSDRAMRRNLDRWVEILINSGIDAAKIILASKHREVPQTYGQILELIEETPPFDALSGRLKHLAALRNLMAHEYLDLRFTRVKEFVRSDAATLGELARITLDWMKNGGGQ